MGATWQIELPFTRPLSLNARMNHWARAKATASARSGAGEVIRLADVPPLEHLDAWIVYSPRDSRVRDPINLIPTLKACEDALVDCHVVPDDNPRFVESRMPLVVAKNNLKRGLLWLVVTETPVPSFVGGTEVSYA